MPTHLVTTYDVLGLKAYPYSSYTGAFHLLAMKAAEKLALWMSKYSYIHGLYISRIWQKEFYQKNIYIFSSVHYSHIY